MRRKRILSILMCMLFLLQMIPYGVSAATSSVPERTTILTSETDKPTTGHSSEDGYFINIKWKDVSASMPSGEWDNTYYNVYAQKISKTGEAGSFDKAATEVSTPYTTIRYLGSEPLESGTVYNIYVTAVYKKTDNGVAVISEGEKSNIVTVMTDIKVKASPYGIKQLEITWDDVWLAGSRISYNLSIAQDSDFAGSLPTPISSSQIGTDGKVNVDSVSHKLKYIYTVPDAGRVYYVKIEPVLGTQDIFFNTTSDTVASASYILVSTTKVSETEGGVLWRLDWSKVAVAFDDINIVYHIYKVDASNNNLEEFILSVDNNMTYLTVLPDDEDSYYIIRAKVTDSNDNDVYEDLNVTIESDDVYLKEYEIPAVPIAPVIVDELLSGTTLVESYSDSLKSTSAAVLWELPKTGEDEIDYDVSYDIWMVKDATKLDDPEDSDLVAENVKVSDILVKSGTNIVGAKYNLTNLVPNSTYYFRVVAKKTYVEYVDGSVEQVPLASEASTKLIITPPEDNGNTPIAISAPPLKVKEVPDGTEKKKVIADTTATITVKNKWYEEYKITKGRWEYVEPNNSTGVYIPNDEMVANDLYADQYRSVVYDGTITIDVGALKVSELPTDFTYNKLNDIDKYPLNLATGVSVTPNDSTENAGLNTDGLKHNVDIPLTGLTPNTNYIIWVRAKRASTGTVSDASDPIYITTTLDGTIVPATPTVPNFNYGYAGDTYVELGWAYNTDYTYNISYSTTENLDKAEGQVTVKGSDMTKQKLLTISDLEKSTDYYFWIQAINPNNGKPISSAFGDAYHLKTTEYTPPGTPYGFGIKSGTDSVTKNSITYEWISVTGLEYILEIADNINYTNSTTYEVGAVSEYTVTGLNSNKRYYARLYAYDSTTELTSEATQSIIVRTAKSTDDYDSNEDTDTVISGDYIVKDDYASGQIWNVEIIGVNADRFVESIKNGKQLEYTLDLDSPPSTVLTTRVKISAKVFTELSRLGRTLIFSIEDYSVSFGPGTLDSYTSKADVYDTFIVSLSSGVDDSKQKPDKLAVKSKIGRVKVEKESGTAYTTIDSFGEAALVSFKMNDISWYNESDSSGYVLSGVTWNKSSSELKQDSLRGRNYVLFQLNLPCDFLVGQYVNSPYTDVLGNWASDYIKTLTEKRDMKSIQGNLFKPDANATISDALKMIFDVTGYNYTSNYIQEAYRAGLIDRNDAIAPTTYCTTEKALYILITMYEKKSGDTLTCKGTAGYVFVDMDSVSYQYSNKVNFAVENGIYSTKNKSNLNPTGNITRAELAEIFVRYLEFIGEVY